MLVVLLALQSCAPRTSRYHLAKARMAQGQSRETQSQTVAELEATENVIGQMETIVRSMARTVDRTETLKTEAATRLARIPSGKGNYSRARSSKKRR